MVGRGGAGPPCRGFDRKGGFRGGRRKAVGRIVFSGEARGYARPWRVQAAERLAAFVPCKTPRRRRISSKIRCATSLLFNFGSARSRPSREKSVTTFVS